MSTFKVFEKAKLTRFINVYGNTFTFRRSSLNDRDEPSNEYSDIAIIDGVYHEVSGSVSGSYVSEMNADGARYIRDQQPMILCLQDEESGKIMPDDIVEIANRRYSVVRLKAVGGYDYAWDISLRLIDDGNAI